MVDEMVCLMSHEGEEEFYMQLLMAQMKEKEQHESLGMEVVVFYVCECEI